LERKQEKKDPGAPATTDDGVIKEEENNCDDKEGMFEDD